MENFLENEGNIANKDISLILVNHEKPEKAAIESIGFSFFNNMVITLFRLIVITNLILLGHLLYEEKVHYQLFMTFQIGVFILEFFGKYFIIGLLKYIFFQDKERKTLYNLYIKIKTALIVLIPLITEPISLISYYILESLFTYSLKINNQDLIKEVYKKFLIFTPVIYFFEILFFLNLKYLIACNRIKLAFMYIICYLICHIVLSWILLFILNYGVFGLTISYCLNSFLFFFFTNRRIYITEYVVEDTFFHLIPNKNNFNGAVLKKVREISFYSAINLGEVFPVQFLFLVGLFIGKNELIVNIIYLNFFELVTEIYRGFYYTIKKELAIKYQDTIQKQNYVLFFSVYYSIISLIVFILLILFKNILLNIYIFKGGEPAFKEIAESLRIIYPLCILCMSAKILLNGIIRSLELPVSNQRRLIYIIICVIFAYIFCFVYDLGIFGIWISMLSLEFLHAGENFAKTMKYFPFVRT
jgi:Na+-driven multidrug efflux pump